jgi:hypothetical protein
VSFLITPDFVFSGSLRRRKTAQALPPEEIFAGLEETKVFNGLAKA